MSLLERITAAGAMLWRWRPLSPPHAQRPTDVFDRGGFLVLDLAIDDANPLPGLL